MNTRIIQNKTIDTRVSNQIRTYWFVAYTYRKMFTEVVGSATISSEEPFFNQKWFIDSVSKEKRNVIITFIMKITEEQHAIFIK